MRRCVISTFLLTLVIALPGSKSVAQCPGSASQCPVITEYKIGADSISVTPITPPDGAKASADVFASCDEPTGSSLLKSGSHNEIYGSQTIPLILTDQLTAGQTLCVIETINGVTNPSAKVTVAIPSPASPTAAPTKLVLQPITAGQTSVTVITVPFGGGTATIDLFHSCGDVRDKTKSLELTSAQTISGTSGLFQLQVKSAFKEGDIVCAAQSNKPDPIVSLPVVVSAAMPIPPPTSPIIARALNDRTTRFRVSGQPNDNNYTGSALYVCVWPASSATPSAGTTQPANNPLDCTAIGSKVQPTAVKGGKTDAVRLSYFQAGKSGETDIALLSPLTPGESVSIVQVSAPVSGKAQTVVSPQAYVVGTTQQCNHKPLEEPYSDCDISFSIIGGVEQAGLSSQPSETNGFLRIFTRAGLSPSGNGAGDSESRKSKSLWDKFLSINEFWGEIRLLSSPQQNSSSGVVAAFTNPSGQITTTSVSNVGSSIDYSLGWEQIFSHGKNRFSLSLIEGGGGTTTLSSNSLTEAFTSPPLGTVECPTLYSRFATFFKADQILLNSPTNDMGSKPGACLLNGNSPTTTNGTTTYAPINTVGFSNQDRSNFLGKYYAGVRSIYRYPTSKAHACGDADPANPDIAPCSRGIVDFTVGQDESITGGHLQGAVVKVEGVYPLPIKGNAFLYLFGAFSVRTLVNQNYSPLILQPASLSALTGTGSTAVPNVNTVVLPLQQPNRDFYRFGIGLDAVCIFTKIFSSSSTCPAAGSTSQ